MLVVTSPISNARRRSCRRPDANAIPRRIRDRSPTISSTSIRGIGRPTSVEDTMDDFFRHASHKIVLVVGSWQVFLLALLLIVCWAASGPIFGFSDT